MFDSYVSINVVKSIEACRRRGGGDSSIRSSNKQKIIEKLNPLIISIKVEKYVISNGRYDKRWY